MKQYPSIFNDVIGPVMIGQSSSHTAASLRIGRVIRQLAGNSAVKSIKFCFDSKSSLATTHSTQGSDIGLLSGLLGFETYDKRIPDAVLYADEEGIDYSFEVKDIGPGHPNAYYVDFTCSDGRRLTLTAISAGGGMMEITDYAGFPVSIDGGFFETLIKCASSQSEDLAERTRKILPAKHLLSISENNGYSLINIKTEKEIKLYSPNTEIRQIKPVLTVISQVAPQVPFVSARGILEFSKHYNKSFWELAVLYESKRSGLSAQAVMREMTGIVDTLQQSLAVPEYREVKERILQNQARLIESNDNVLGGSFNRNVIKYVTRFMDIKTSMGVFVAAPTAGACGCLSGCIFALGEELGLGYDDLAKALLSAGLVGVIIARHSTFAAELCGCQAECGAGSAMAAAACAGILASPVKTCLAAASMALQNILGLVCDPVGNKVEVPCLGKNILGAFNAIASANMAASGYAEVIPLDETIAAMDAVGCSIPRELRCTGLGGLSTTKTSIRYLRSYEQN
ncbi:MAG: L-serine ammonia-lyase, iron-sulfur-dependent, subunit alpha [Clostridiales bacterium]|jgi:L-serine dehydratase|nr:L-serine ammonia-lyase, iron-sulfur-dependent, subunit alpha [Clostridiales bacterium]